MSRATVPGPDPVSSRRSISGNRRSWLTAPAREIGSAACTATGIRAAESGVPGCVVRDELSNRFPYVRVRAAFVGRWRKCAPQPSGAGGPSAIVEDHEGDHEIGKRA